LSRLENGLRIFEQDEYGKDDEVGQGGKTSGSSFVVHGSDDDDPVTTNAADIKAPGCKVRRAIDWVYFKNTSRFPFLQTDTTRDAILRSMLTNPIFYFPSPISSRHPNNRVLV
jgi:hypothetical protein